MKWANFILNFIIGGLVGLLIGWIIAHSIVSIECDKLGGFYVGDKIYYCTEKL